MARAALIGTSSAAQLCEISPELIRYRAFTGKLPIARRRPLRFRLADVLAARPRMQQKDPRGRKRKSQLETLIAEVLS